MEFYIWLEFDIVPAILWISYGLKTQTTRRKYNRTFTAIKKWLKSKVANSWRYSSSICWATATCTQCCTLFQPIRAHKHSWWLQMDLSNWFSICGTSTYKRKYNGNPNVFFQLLIGSRFLTKSVQHKFSKTVAAAQYLVALLGVFGNTTLQWNYLTYFWYHQKSIVTIEDVGVELDPDQTTCFRLGVNDGRLGV